LVELVGDCLTAIKVCDLHDLGVLTKVGLILISPYEERVGFTIFYGFMTFIISVLNEFFREIMK
jgi:hypothetical protein